MVDGRVVVRADPFQRGEGGLGNGIRAHGARVSPVWTMRPSSVRATASAPGASGYAPPLPWPPVAGADDVVQTQPRRLLPPLPLWIGEVRAGGCGVRVADYRCTHQ